MIVFFLSLNIFITACSTTSVVEVSPTISIPTIVLTSTKTSTPTQIIRSTNTPTTTLQPTFTPTPNILPAETPKPIDTPETELHLRLKNPKGEPVPFSKAELLIDAWSFGTEQIAFPLKTEGNLLVLSLNDELIRKTWSIDDLTWIRNYFVYLEASGYVPVRSKGMYFIGTDTREAGLAEKVVVEFQNGPKVTITKGETKEIELTLREPQKRYLLFVDDNHQPVSGVKVGSYMFWSNSNHCGYPQGANLLAEEISDQEGRVTIPDGEFEYLLEFEKPLYHLKETSYFDPMGLITYLSSQETIIELHKLNKQPIKMVVRENGKPQAKKTLFGQWIGCCGLCPQELAVTDDKGRISLEEFYPEEWDWLFFDKDQVGAGFAWEADPKEFSGPGLIEVELSK